MQGSGVRSEAAPLLEDGDGEDNHQLRRGNCLSRFWDCDELKNQLLIAFPMILTNVFYYAITLVSVMFAGHLGELELAGANLGNSWATVTGFAFMTGLSGGLETLCGQGFGAGVYRMLGIYLQSSCIISFLFSVLISILWMYTEPILILLQQDPRIAETAALYTKCLIPGIFAYGFLQNGLRFLQTQSVVTPLILLSAIPAAIHFGVVYGMVHGTSLGFKGGPIAASVSLWVSVLSIGVYIVFSDKFKRTMEGFSVESFHYILPGLKLALPSAAMVCLEYWAFEILVLLAGLMPNSEITTSLTAMCVNTEAISFMITYGLSAAASTRVSNELGAGNPNRGKTAMFLSVKLSVLLAAATVLLLAFGHNLWAGFFTSSSLIIGKFGSVTSLLAISITLDSVQGVLSGVARGCGWQHLAVYTNLTTFYLIGMPVAVLLAFKVKLYFKGLWIGVICGLATQTCTLLVITLRRKWTAIDFSSERVKETPDFV